MSNVIVTSADKKYIDMYGEKFIKSIRTYHGRVPIKIYTDTPTAIAGACVVAYNSDDICLNVHKANPFINYFTKLHKPIILKKHILWEDNPIFIDIDTVCFDELDFLFDCDHPIMRDEYPHSVGIEPKLHGQYYPEDAPDFSGVKHNYNTGVLAGFTFRDLPLLNYWEGLMLKHWFEGLSDRGDQFFFNTAVMKLNYEIDPLPKEFNHLSLMMDGPINQSTAICHFAGHKGDVYNKHLTRFPQDNWFKRKLERIC